MGEGGYSAEVTLSTQLGKFFHNIHKIQWREANIKFIHFNKSVIKHYFNLIQ